MSTVARKAAFDVECAVWGGESEAVVAAVECVSADGVDFVFDLELVADVGGCEGV